MLDQQVIDGVVKGVGGGIKSFGTSLSSTQTGWLRWYGAVMVTGAFLVLLWLLFRAGLF